MTKRKKTTMLTSGLRGILCCLMLAPVLAGCLGDDNSNVDTTPVAYVSIYHASPDAPAVDIYASNQKLNASSFAYGGFSGYATFVTGNRDLAFKSTGTTTVLLDSTYTLAENTFYSLFLVNNAADMEGLLVKDVTDVATENNAKIRFVNLSPDAPAINITKDAETSPVLATRSFKQITEFQNIAGGTYTFNIRDAGTGESLTLVSSKKIEAGKYYTLIARGFLNPPQGNTNQLSLDLITNE